MFSYFFRVFVVRFPRRLDWNCVNHDLSGNFFGPVQRYCSSNDKKNPTENLLNGFSAMVVWWCSGYYASS